MISNLDPTIYLFAHFITTFVIIGKKPGQIFMFWYIYFSTVSNSYFFYKTDGLTVKGGG